MASKSRRYFVGLAVRTYTDNWKPAVSAQASFAFHSPELAGKCLAAALSRTDWALGFMQVTALGYTPIRSVSIGESGDFTMEVSTLDLWAVVAYPPLLNNTLRGIRGKQIVPFRREPTVFLGDHLNARASVVDLKDNIVPYADIKEAAEWTFVMSTLASSL